MLKKKRIPWFVIASAVFVFLFTSLFSYFIFDHIPHIHDEIDYLFQAKIFRLGHLYVQSPCAKEFFNFPHIINNGKWYSHYTPGYPLLLLLGLLIGAPWLINPLFAYLSIILFYYLGKEIYDRHIGIVSAILGALSIWFLLMSSTMMSHTSCLFFVSLFLLFLFRSVKNPSVANGLIAGGALGTAILIRPYNSFFIAFPFLLYFAVKLLKGFRVKFKNALVFAVMVVISISILLVYNQITNGHYLRMGYIASHGTEHGIGFGKTGYIDYAYTPFLGVKYFFGNLKEINSYLFGWPISSFLALLPLFLIRKRNKEKIKKDLLLATCLFSLSVGMFIYWASFSFIGARMYFEIIPILLLLSAHGISELPRIFISRFKKLDQSKCKKILALILIVFSTYAFFIKFPKWIWPPDKEGYYHQFNNNFAGVNSYIHNTIESIVPRRSLVIMKFMYYPQKYFPDGLWGSGFLYNDPELEESIIYAQDKGIKNIDLFQCFPKRKIFLYFGTLEKGMLVPLGKNGTTIKYGKPISTDSNGKKFVTLINNPLKFYKIYSTDFENFLSELYRQNNPFEIDVARMYKLGLLSYDNARFKEAVFYLEAALQIEKQAERRYDFLNKLVSFYIKAGSLKEAKIILNKIEDIDKEKFYNIFPEKGF